MYGYAYIQWKIALARMRGREDEESDVILITIAHAAV
jgi:hypothetical protein